MADETAAVLLALGVAVAGVAAIWYLSRGRAMGGFLGGGYVDTYAPQNVGGYVDTYAPQNVGGTYAPQNVGGYVDTYAPQNVGGPPCVTDCRCAYANCRGARSCTACWWLRGSQTPCHPTAAEVQTYGYVCSGGGGGPIQCGAGGYHRVTANCVYYCSSGNYCWTGGTTAGRKTSCAQGSCDNARTQFLADAKRLGIAGTIGVHEAEAGPDLPWLEAGGSPSGPGTGVPSYNRTFYNPNDETRLLVVA